MPLQRVIARRRGCQRLLTPATIVSPTFRSAVRAGGGAGTLDPTIVLPGDIAAGDFLILTWASFYQPGGDPVGWTRDLLNTSAGGPNPGGVGSWHKTAVAGDAGATVHIPLGVSSDYWTLGVAVYKGTTTGGLRSVVSSLGAAGVASFPTPASTATAKDTVVSVWSMEAGSSGGLAAFTLDAAVVQRVRSDWGGGINQFSHVGIGDEVAAGGATTPRSAAWAFADTSWSSLAYVLKPLP